MKKIIFAILCIIILAAISQIHFDKTVEDLRPQYTNTESEFMDLAGMKVHYRDEGPILDSLPIVLLHGTGASLHTWEAWVKELSKSKRVITLDLPGYGLTGPEPSHNYGMEFYAKFTHDFLSKLKVKTCILGGNSLGGLIAWRTVLAYPKIAKAMILVDAAGYQIKSKSQPMAFRVAALPVVGNIFKYITPKAVVRKSIENVYVQDSLITDALVDRFFNLSLRTGNREAFIRRMQQFNTDRDKEFDQKTDQIKSIAIPVLILWGAEDELIPVDIAYKFHNDLPNDTLVVLPNLGHTPMEENPAATLKVVTEFLNKIE